MRGLPHSRDAYRVVSVMGELIAAITVGGALAAWAWDRWQAVDARLDAIQIEQASAREKLEAHTRDSVLTRQMLVDRLDSDRELQQAKLEMIWEKIKSITECKQ